MTWMRAVNGCFITHLLSVLVDDLDERCDRNAGVHGIEGCDLVEYRGGRMDGCLSVLCRRDGDQIFCLSFVFNTTLALLGE